MGFLEKAGELTARLLTIDVELRNVKEAAADNRHQLDMLDEKLQRLEQRIVRLETQRDADRAQMEAEVARFKAEVLQAEARLSRLLPPPQAQTPHE